MHANALLTRWSRAAALLLAAVVLTGCAAFNQVGVDVASFGNWPTGRAAGAFAFDRLPSQTDGGPAQDTLEAAARDALERVGFSAATDAARADVLVQVGTRTGRLIEPSGSPFGWGVGLGARSGGRVSGGVSLGFPIGPAPGSLYFGPPGWPYDYSRDYREASLLLIDRPSRKVLLELRARTEGRMSGDALLAPLFEAMLQGFPDIAPGTRRVTVPLDPTR